MRRAQIRLQQEQHATRISIFFIISSNSRALNSRKPASAAPSRYLRRGTLDLFLRSSAERRGSRNLFSSLARMLSQRPCFFSPFSQNTGKTLDLSQPLLPVGGVTCVRFIINRIPWAIRSWIALFPNVVFAVSLCRSRNAGGFPLGTFFPQLRLPIESSFRRNLPLSIAVPRLLSNQTRSLSGKKTNFSSLSLARFLRFSCSSQIGVYATDRPSFIR